MGCELYVAARLQRQRDEMQESKDKRGHDPSDMIQERTSRDQRIARGSLAPAAAAGPMWRGRCVQCVGGRCGEVCV